MAVTEEQATTSVMKWSKGLETMAASQAGERRDDHGRALIVKHCKFFVAPSTIAMDRGTLSVSNSLNSELREQLVFSSMTVERFWLTKGSSRDSQQLKEPREEGTYEAWHDAPNAG